jgi:DNA-binding transcriptional LysR family regulator
MDRFEAMRAFSRVVETGSFSKAAETLNISRTSVTQLIQQLEARLRVRLLNRTTRRVSVTHDGAQFHERVQRLLADLEEAESSLGEAAQRPRGKLRVDVPSPLARLVLVPALAEFHARYPDIQIEMGVSDRMVDIIGEHVDCVVRGGELLDQSLMARRVADLQLGVYAAPAYLERLGTPDPPRRTGRLGPSCGGVSLGANRQAVAAEPGARSAARAGPGALRVGSRRWQRLPRGRPGWPGRALVAGLHGP